MLKVPALFLSIVIASGCAAFGERSTGARLSRVQSSPQYNAVDEAFKNVNPEFKMGDDYWGILKEAFGGDQIRIPTEPLPEVKPDLAAFEAPSDEIKFIWFGHSTFLTRMGGKSILIDPVFGEYASPVAIFGKRYQPPVLQANELPEIDVILISHDHYDHLEMETVEHFATKNTKFIVPLGIGAHLESWGVPTDRITELDWWQSVEFDGFKYTCTPAQHFSGRTGLRGNDTLWASWVVEGAQKKVYYSGDTGYFTHFKEIGDKLGPFDVTFLENGQYNERWKGVHQMPEEAVQAFVDLKGHVMVPVHWGAYELSFHDWFEPAERATNEAEKRHLRIALPKLGELVDLSQMREWDRWWRTSPDFPTKDF